MSSKNQKPDTGLTPAISSLTVQEDDVVKPSDTLSTIDSLSPTSTTTTPRAQKEEDDHDFRSPQANTTWEDKGLSPTMLGDHDEAMQLFESDDMKNKKFYSSGSSRLKACVQYVYGLEFYKDLDPADRIEKIKKLVETKEKLARLASVVFSLAKDALMITKDKKKAYIQMAITSYIFSNHHELKGWKRPKTRAKRYRGGFPKKAIMLNQLYRNCYQPATVAWVTLTEQCSTHDQDGILDTAQVGRRYLMKNPEQLEGRVINNQGFSVATFAKMVVNESADVGWSELKLWDEERIDINPTVLSGYIMDRMDTKGVFGLISNFHVYQPFHAAATEHMQRQHKCELGYFLFDGDSVETEGRWVSYDDEFGKDKKFREAVKELQASIETELDDQDKRGKEQHEKTLQKLRSQFPSEETNFSAKESSSTERQSSGTHAMVLIAYEQDKGSGETIFLVCNSWYQMPIVGMSASYLRACEATIHWGPGEHSIDGGLQWTKSLVADCTSYEVEGGGDGCDFPIHWLQDAFGYSVSSAQTNDGSGSRFPKNGFEMVFGPRK